MRSTVVLPQPDGPTSTANSLSSISMDRSSTTLTAPNCLTTFFRVTPDMALILLSCRRGKMGLRRWAQAERIAAAGRDGRSAAAALGPGTQFMLAASQLAALRQVKSAVHSRSGHPVLWTMAQRTPEKQRPQSGAQVSAAAGCQIRREVRPDERRRSLPATVSSPDGDGFRAHALARSACRFAPSRHRGRDPPRSASRRRSPAREPGQQLVTNRIR